MKNEIIPQEQADAEENCMNNDIITKEQADAEEKSNMIERLPVPPLNYEKSNLLINGRYKMSKNALKTLAYALSLLRGMSFSDRDMEMGISVDFTSADIKRVLLNPNAARRGSLSKELKDIANNLHGTTVFIMDEEDGDFVSFPFIKTCKYQKDVFRITFHENMSPFIVNLERKGNFTVLDVNHIKGMRHGYTIRIYEICKSLAYKAKANYGIFMKSFNIVEFKLMIGLIDSEDSHIRTITSRYKKDYETIAQKIEELYESSVVAIEEINKKLNSVSELDLKGEALDIYIKALQNSKAPHSKTISEIHKYRSPSELRRKVLDVAKEELNHMMDQGEVDICFDYTLRKRNRRIEGFNLIILTKEGRETFRKQQEESNRQFSLFDYGSFNSSEQLSETNSGKKKGKKNDKADIKYKKKEEVPDTLELIENYFNSHPHKINLTIKEKYKLACLFDSDEIIDKFNQMECAGEVRNPIGWMIKAIQENYKKPANGGKRNQINDFQQNTYDFEQLEKDLLAN